MGAGHEIYKVLGTSPPGTASLFKLFPSEHANPDDGKHITKNCCGKSFL
jgi:hypothetical protein